MESQFQFLSLPSTILSSFLFLSFLLLFILRRKSNTSPSSKTPPPPPGPTKLPIIGNLHQLAGGSLPHHRLRDLSKTYGGVMGLQLGQVPHVFISSAESAKQVMKTHDVIFAQRPKLLAASIISYGMSDIAFAPYGAYWRQLRKICILELLSAKRVQSFRSIREEEVSNAVARITASSGREFNFSKMIVSSTHGIAARITFGKKYKGQDQFIPVVEEITQVAGGFSLADLFPSVKLLQLLSGTRSQLLKLRGEVDKMLDGIIAEHRSKGRTAEDSAAGGEVDDLVDVLLKLQGSGDLEFPLTDGNIKAVILDIFIAGSETSSTTVNWAMSEMVKNPRVMEKAQAEARRVFGSKGEVDETLLDELNYLKLVIKETMRLHSPAPLLLPRECSEDCEIDGFLVKAKSKVMVNVWALGRDPKYWDEPEEFRPERFMDNSIDFKGLNFEFLPFGAGRRMCPGIVFGLANVELPLAYFLYHFDWKLPGGAKGEDLDMTESFGATVTKKNDLMLIPTPSHSSS
ncbi:Desmethyl-deoxy-podophyllotoxin synthase [Linum grandiflorum]